MRTSAKPVSGKSRFGIIPTATPSICLVETYTQCNWNFGGFTPVIFGDYHAEAEYAKLRCKHGIPVAAAHMNR